jgi:hypothetical protein
VTVISQGTHPLGTLVYILHYTAIKKLSLSFHLCSLHLSLSTATYCNTLSALSQGEIREGKEEEHAVLDKNSKIDLHIKARYGAYRFHAHTPYA